MGFWCGEFEGDIMFESYMIFFEVFFGCLGSVKVWVFVWVVCVEVLFGGGWS